MFNRKIIILFTFIFIGYSIVSSNLGALKDLASSPVVSSVPQLAEKPATLVESLATSSTGQVLISKLFKADGPLVNTKVAEEKAVLPAVTSLDSIIGEGEKAACGDNVSLHYSFFLADGTKLDSTRETNHPVTFIIGKNNVIHGLELGVIGMQKGGVRKLTIPPSLAYDNPKFTTSMIPASSIIKAEIELLKISPSANAAANLNCI